MSIKPKLMLVELNEFDPNYVGEAAVRLGLTSLKKAVSFRHTRSTTDDAIEHQGLDPWVQWVGVHCGRPTSEHGIRRLGTTRAQTSTQIWHAVAREGYTWGAWGVMNAPRGNPQGCKFFMPDPWSFEEEAYPAYFNDLLALPRYIAKNYLEIDRGKAFMEALRLVRFFAPPAHWPLLARFGGRMLRAVAKTGPNVHTFTTLLDYLSVLCVLRLRREFRPDLTVIFLNHLAHLQHQFWLKGGDIHPEMLLGLELSNAMMGLLLADRGDDEAFLLMNGLKQKNVAGEGFHVYRQRNPQSAIESMGVVGGKVEQCMSHDAHILFDDPANADRAIEILGRCCLSDGHKTFYVERQGPLQVFYQLTFEHKVAPDTNIISGNYIQPFDAEFELICERTGAHVPEGDVFADKVYVPDVIKNHQIYDVVVNYFRQRTPAALNAAE